MSQFNLKHSYDLNTMIKCGAVLGQTWLATVEDVVDQARLREAITFKTPLSIHQVKQFYSQMGLRVIAAYCVDSSDSRTVLN